MKFFIISANKITIKTAIFETFFTLMEFPFHILYMSSKLFGKKS